MAAREQTRLDLLRNLELSLEPLFLALLLKQALNRGGHGVERLRKRCELILARHFNTVGKVSAVHRQGRPVEIVDRSSDGLIKAHRHQKRAKLQKAKKDSQRNQQILHKGGYFERGDRQSRVEQGGSRRDVHAALIRFAASPVHGIEWNEEVHRYVEQVPGRWQPAPHAGVRPHFLSTRPRGFA